MVTPDELGLTGCSDEDHFAISYRNKRILLTHDEDFLDNRKFPQHRNPGVVVLPGASGNIDILADALRLVLAFVAPYRDLWQGSKIKIGMDGHVTVWNYDYTGCWSETRYKVEQHRCLMWIDDWKVE